MQKQNKTQEKPQYGTYMGLSIFFVLLFLSIMGIGMIVVAFFIKSVYGIVIFGVGCLFSVLFIWPCIGIIVTECINKREDDLHFDFFNNKSKLKILDCGCGTGRHAIKMVKQMNKTCHLTGFDIFDVNAITGNSLERVKHNAELEGVSPQTEFIKASITEIPFQNKSFDVVTCMGVVHDLRNKQLRTKAFQEMKRVLKDNGTFYLRELLKRAFIIKYGPLAALSFKHPSYWEAELNKHGFEITDFYQNSYTLEFIAKK